MLALPVGWRLRPRRPAAQRDSADATALGSLQAETATGACRTRVSGRLPARRNPSDGCVGSAPGRNDNTATPMPGLFCAVPAFSDSTLFHAVPARSDATALAFPITTASRWSAIWLARPCPRGIGAGRPTLGRSTTRFARGILPARSALCREAVDAGAVATGAKIKPGESGEALHREPLNAGEVPCPSTCPAASCPSGALRPN